VPTPSHDALKKMIAAPYCAIIDQSELSVPPRSFNPTDPHDRLALLQRAHEIAQLAARQGMADVFNWERIAQRSKGPCGFVIGGQPNRALMARTTQTSGDFTLTAPLAYRLHRPTVPIYAIVMLDRQLDQSEYGFFHQERRPALSNSDRHHHIAIHETLHAVQRQYADDGLKESLLDLSERERDAENGATIAFQTALGGSRPLAAALIVHHTLAAGLFYAPQYKWWPGLPENKLGQGALYAHMAVAAGLYAASQKPVPDPEMLGAWANAVVGHDYKAHRLMYGQPFEDMCNFILPQVQENRVDSARQAIGGLARLGERAQEVLPGPAYHFAQRMVDAAAFVCPGWTGHDALARPTSLGVHSPKNSP
jgi:hypothetical protein